MNHFESIYYDSYANNEIRQEYEDCWQSALYTEMQANNDISFDDSSISVALVDRCIRNLNLDKAAGPDELMCEHILYAHPLVVLHLTQLFRSIAIHGYVPEDFGKGLVVPIIKEKLLNANDLNNYRGITLIPVISKLFELVILEVGKEYFNTDELQFGFKAGSGCSHAIFLMTETIKYFLEKGSSVFVAALDLKKAFDRVSHLKLFTTLLKKKVPVWIIKSIIGSTQNYQWWYAGKEYIRSFHVKCGVRQGGPLSPTLFNMFVDDCITDVRGTNAGCQIGEYYMGIIIYADDILLLSPTILGLQSMLDQCSQSLAKKCLEFNAKNVIALL